jgi:N-acetylglucosaminyldiphosphoundecaprenol N-acetyl-beta-D-mannosaminyltransferase
MKNIYIAGIKINNITVKEVIDEVAGIIERKYKGYIVTPNAAHIVLLQKDKEFQDLYENANLILPDGVSLMWASRILGKSLQEKISGSDLLPLLCEVAAKKAYKVFFLGGAPGIAESARIILTQKYPGLKISGVCCPPYGFENDTIENENIIRMINSCMPDLLFVGLGTPKQEKWIYKYRNQYNAIVSIGIGASFDFVVGRLHRGPRWVQKIGLEWLFRFIQEPRRLWKRYLIGNAVFMWLVMKDLIKGGTNDKEK